MSANLWYGLHRHNRNSWLGSHYLISRIQPHFEFGWKCDMCHSKRISLCWCGLHWQRGESSERSGSSNWQNVRPSDVEDQYLRSVEFKRLGKRLGFACRIFHRAAWLQAPLLMHTHVFLGIGNQCMGNQCGNWILNCKDGESGTAGMHCASGSVLISRFMKDLSSIQQEETVVQKHINKLAKFVPSKALCPQFLVSRIENLI